VEQARDKVMMGLKRQGLSLTEDEKKMIAYHEGGHAVTAAFLENADPLHKVSIIPRTRSLGATLQLPQDERYIYPREYLLDRLAVMMGGRAAESLIFETATSGAGSDLQEATKLARKMVLEWGMSEKFRHMALGQESENVFLGEQIARKRDYAEATAREVDEEVQAILDTAFERSRQILEEHRQGLDDLAEQLLETEEILGDDALRILGLDPEQARSHEEST
jgi:cell division protease FtsH